MDKINQSFYSANFLSPVFNLPTNGITYFNNFNNFIQVKGISSRNLSVNFLQKYLTLNNRTVDLLSWLEKTKQGCKCVLVCEYARRAGQIVAATSATRHHRGTNNHILVEFSMDDITWIVIVAVLVEETKFLYLVVN